VGFIETLININKDIDEGMVKRYMPSNEEANEFWLSSLIKARDADNLYKQLSLIPNDEDIKVLSLLLKDYRVAYKLKYFGEKEVGTARTEFAELSKEMLNKAMNVITEGIYAIKSGYLPKEHALKSVCSQLLTIN
jgi:DNA polymerase III delta subunit